MTGAFFLGKGFRVIAHDRCGRGRSLLVDDGHDLDHYADDLAPVTAHLDLKGDIMSAIRRLAARSSAISANRTKLYCDLPAGPFRGFNRPGVATIEPVIWNCWRPGVMGGAKAHYDGVAAFSQTDFTGGPQKDRRPVLVMRGEDDQIVPYANDGPLSRSS